MFFWKAKKNIPEKHELTVTIKSRYEMHSYEKHLDNRCFALSIYTPGREPVQIPIPTLHVSIVDTETENGITKEDAQAMASFIIQNMREGRDHIIIQSDWGTSRSAGIAAAILKAGHEDNSWILDDGFYCINVRCYEYMCKALHVPVQNETLEYIRDKTNAEHRAFVEKHH